MRADPAIGLAQSWRGEPAGESQSFAADEEGRANSAGVAFSFSENYAGESFCKDTPSWPNGTYLGQMHPFHSTFYRGFAERRGWDPCVTWAQDQRNSAIRGLRELG